MNAQIREYEESDREALISLWTRVFGDPPDLINGFLRLLPDMGTCCVAESAGKLLSAAYGITGFTLSVPNHPVLPCGYIYAVASDESVRGQGLGAAVSRGAADLCRARGAGMICTLPAEPSLYSWYDHILGLKYVLTRTICSVDRLPSCIPIHAEEYGILRESMLQGVPHVICSPAVLEFQELLCRCYGGGFYQTNSGLLCAYPEDGHWHISEYLGAELNEDVSTIPYLCCDHPLSVSPVWNITFD